MHSSTGAPSMPEPQCAKLRVLTESESSNNLATCACETLALAKSLELTGAAHDSNVGASMTRIGFWAPV